MLPVRTSSESAGVRECALTQTEWIPAQHSRQGGRKTQAEINFAQKIGTLGMRADKMYTQAVNGELPPEMRKLYSDYMKPEQLRTAQKLTLPSLNRRRCPGRQRPGTEVLWQKAV